MKARPKPPEKVGIRQQAESAAVPMARSASPGDQACCCPARAAVRVIMPPSPARPHTTDLLLCAHHFRVSHCALIAAQAAICELPGISRYAAAQFDRVG
jgi:hypothetical protein